MISEETKKIEKDIIKAEIVFKWFHSIGIKEIADSLNISKNKVNEIINEYLKPENQKYKIIESKMNNLIID